MKIPPRNTPKVKMSPTKKMKEKTKESVMMTKRNFLRNDLRERNIYFSEKKEIFFI